VVRAAAGAVATAGAASPAAAGAGHLYLDLMSQPCRAVALFARLHGMPLQTVNTIIHKRQHREAAFDALNPKKQIPVLEEADDGGFVLTESTTIMRYLAARHGAAEHWYPHRGDDVATLRERARVDAACDWYHAALRPAAKDWTYHRVIAARLGGSVDLAAASAGRKRLERSLALLERWLRESRPTHCLVPASSRGGGGGDSTPWTRITVARGPIGGARERAVNIADIRCVWPGEACAMKRCQPLVAAALARAPARSMACELTQLWMLPPDEWSDEAMAQAFPHVHAWQRDMATLPHWDDVHTILRKSVAYLSQERSGERRAPGAPGS